MSFLESLRFDKIILGLIGIIIIFFQPAVKLETWSLTLAIALWIVFVLFFNKLPSLNLPAIEKKVELRSLKECKERAITVLPQKYRARGEWSFGVEGVGLNGFVLRVWKPGSGEEFLAFGSRDKGELSPLLSSLKPFSQCVLESRDRHLQGVLRHHCVDLEVEKK